MRLLSVLSTFSLLAAALAAPGPGNGNGNGRPGREYRCSKTIRGKERLRKAQEAAIKDFGHLFLVERNITKAFDRYVPDEYINHNPFATTGRQAALDVLVPALANPNLVYDFKASFAGEGNGVLHYRMTQAGVVDYAIMDRYRFVGDCIVEHWDTAWRITGTEPNPIAYF